MQAVVGFNQPELCSAQERQALKKSPSGKISWRSITMWEPLSYSLVILFTCLINVGEIRAQCEQPSIGANRIPAESTGLNVFPEGTILTYKCATGYVPVQSGGPRTITCQEKQWTNLELQCKRKSCGSLGELDHGKYLTPDGILFGATATAQCNTGYIVIGGETRKCRENGWDGRQAVCEVLKCKPPSTIPHGMFAPIEEDYDYDQLVTYSCDKDYTIFGESTIACSDNGSFPLPPRCSLVVCERPYIENANRVEGKSPPYGYKNTVRYECVQGYELSGSDSLVCEEKGWNRPLPTCISKTKDRIDPTPKPIPDHTPTPDNDRKKQLAIGIGLGVLAGAVIIGVVVYFLKKRSRSM